MDGLFLICKKNRLEEYQQIIKEFESFSQLTMETDEFEAMYQLAVNSYIAVKKGYTEAEEKDKNNYIKEKGMVFTTIHRIGKGLYPLIIPKALHNYFLKNIPIRNTILNSTDIKDFLLSQRVNKEFEVEWNNQKQQHTNRFYASKSGYYLFKIKPNNNERIVILGSSPVMLFNDFEIKNNIQEYNINYAYYINECNKIINEMQPQQLTLF